MSPEERQFMVDFLSNQQEPGFLLLSLNDADLDARVKVIVRQPGTGNPRLAQATVLSKNNTPGYEGVLCECFPGYSEFPLDYPCLWDGSKLNAEEIYG